MVREFVDACNKHNIVPFFYHTTLDWYNKDFDNDFDSYLEYLRKSVEILCKNYGKIGGKSLYIFAYDLGNLGDGNVTVGNKYSGSYAFSNVTDKIKSIEWMDNGKQLDFTMKDDMLMVNLTGYEYGRSLGVRVAKAIIE